MEFWENLRMRLENSGFRKVRNKENWYWRAENPVLYLLCLLDREEDPPGLELLPKPLGPPPKLPGPPGPLGPLGGGGGGGRRQRRRYQP